MNAIYFIELKNGKRYYKTDSFWSKSVEFKYAKLHLDTKNDQDRFFISLCGIFKPYKDEELNNDDYKRISDNYIGSLYGYQTILSKGEVFCPNENSILSEPIYLIYINSIDKKGNVEYSDARTILRDKKITEILN